MPITLSRKMAINPSLFRSSLPPPFINLNLQLVQLPYLLNFRFNSETSVYSWHQNCHNSQLSSKNYVQKVVQISSMQLVTLPPPGVLRPFQAIKAFLRDPTSDVIGGLLSVGGFAMPESGKIHPILLFIQPPSSYRKFLDAMIALTWL